MGGQAKFVGTDKGDRAAARFRKLLKKLKLPFEETQYVEPHPSWKQIAVCNGQCGPWWVAEKNITVIYW